MRNSLSGRRTSEAGSLNLDYFITFEECRSTCPINGLRTNACKVGFSVTSLQLLAWWPVLLSLQESNSKGDPADNGRAECEQDREVNSCAKCPQPKGGGLFRRRDGPHKQLGNPPTGVNDIGKNPIEQD